MSDPQRAFERATHLAVGVEEELFLLDPATFDPAPEAGDVVDELGDPAFRCEFSPAQVELVTDPHHTAAGAVAELQRRRAQLLAGLGGRLRIAGVGAHPVAPPLSDAGHTARYRLLLDQHQLGIRLGGSAAGLHIHVGVRGADKALRVYNRVRGLMPLVTALAANAPYVGGTDSGLATVRPKLCDALPRQGVGPRLGSWHEFICLLEWGVQSGAVPDPSQLWWECRPNTRVGTIEVRAPDAQFSLDHVHALVTLVQALVADCCERDDAGEPQQVHETWKIQENRWRAARYGLEGELVDLDAGVMQHTRVVVHGLLDRLTRDNAHAAANGLGGIHGYIDENLPAQHRWVARRGTRALAGWLADQTEGSATTWSP